MLQMQRRRSAKELRPLLAFYEFSPWSFLKLLAENCMAVLRHENKDFILKTSKIYAAMMMLQTHKYELPLARRKVNPKRLLHG